MNQNINSAAKNDTVRLHPNKQKEDEQLLRRARIIHGVPPDGLRVKVLSPDGEYTCVGARDGERIG